MPLRGEDRDSRLVPRALGTARGRRAAVKPRPFAPSGVRRVRPRVFLAVAMAFSALVWAGAAAGAVAGRPAAKTPATRRISEEDGDASSASRTGRLGSYQTATSRGNNSRDGWYPDESGLSPEIVGSPDFGQVFQTQLNGQIYAQPVLVGHILLVATETNWVYGLNPMTGAIEWSRQIGKPFADAPLKCGDLLPDLGVTSTPTVDPATGIAYLVDQAHLPGNAGVAWFMNAINPATGAEMPHFPVEIKGPPSNNPLQPFIATKELQRPGLLFLDGVVYAAFGSHCDYLPYSGIIVGVSTSGKQTTMWSDEGTGTGSGGGIWQGGGGLVSPGPGQIFFESGNGFGESADPQVPTPGSKPPANLADSVVRLIVQPDGSLKAKNFFSMYDDRVVDEHDWDLAGAPVALPPEFSAPGYPHLLVATGKQGVVYLLDRDSLGGVGEGPHGKDLILGEYGPIGDTISTAGAWPGDGGYVYVSTTQSASGGAGEVDVFKFMVTSKGLPALRLVATGSQPTYFGVSGPLVTSDGTASGSAVVWIINGAAHLQAYDPVPEHGKLMLLGSWFIGNNVAFTPPGIGNNMVYAGDQAGLLSGFGVKTASSVSTDVRMVLR